MLMKNVILSSPIIPQDGDFGEFKNLKGVMRILMEKVIECLQSKDKRLLDGLKIAGVNDPFDRNTQGDHSDNIYSLDDAKIKIESFYAGAIKLYKSYYLRIYSTEIRNGRHEILKFFRVAGYTHKKWDPNETVTLTKEESRIAKKGKEIELLAANIEDIYRAIRDAVEKLNELIEKKTINPNYDETDEMVDEISKLSKN